MIAAGVLAGARTPNIATDVYPGTPAAATVGRPGASAEGWALVTATALNLPDLMCGVTAGAAPNINCTWPPIRSLSAGAMPLYGIRMILTPVIALNNSAAR